MPTRSEQAGHLVQLVDYLVRGVTNIERQRSLIRDLERDGHDTWEALRALERMEELQDLYTSDKDGLIADLARKVD